MLTLKRIAVSGYRSFNNEAVIGGLDMVNVIVGPNNVGKSNLFRLFMLLQAGLRAQRGSWGNDWRATTRLSFDLSENDYWMHAPRHIRVEVTCKISGVNSGNVGVFAADGDWINVRFDLVRNYQNGIITTNVVRPNGDGLIRATTTGEPEIRVSTGYTGSFQMNEPILKVPDQICSAFCDGFFAVQAIRQTSAPRRDGIAVPSETYGQTNGTEIIHKLWTLSSDGRNSGRWAKIKRKLQLWISLLLGYEVEIEVTTDAMFVSQHFATETVRLGLSGLGSGVSQFVIVLGFLLLNPDDGAVIAIEEPEAHLHPGAIIELIRLVQTEFPKHQLLISTHSPTLLDGVQPGWRVFRTSRDATGESKFTALDVTEDRIALLADLGARPGQLLLANCILWVEGPSDVYYLRRLIRECGPDLLEGRTHSFVVYGGALVSYLEIDGGEGMVRVLSVSTANAIICDRDRPEGEMPLKPAIEALKKAAQRLPDAARVCPVPAREIELLVVPAIMESAAKIIIPACSLDDRFELSFSDLSWNQDERFHVQLAKAAFAQQSREITAEQRAWIERKIARSKTELALSVTQVQTATVFEPAMQAYGRELVSFIRDKSGVRPPRGA